LGFPLVADQFHRDTPPTDTSIHLYADSRLRSDSWTSPLVSGWHKIMKIGSVKVKGKTGELRAKSQL
jgi:hypothetical protein